MFCDNRGWFMESWSEKDKKAPLLKDSDIDFVYEEKIAGSCW